MSTALAKLLVSTCLSGCRDDTALGQHSSLWSCTPPSCAPLSPSSLGPHLAPVFQCFVSSPHSHQQDDWEADVGQEAGHRGAALSLSSFERRLPGPASSPSSAACRLASPLGLRSGRNKLGTLWPVTSKLGILQCTGCCGFPLSGPWYCPLEHVALGGNGVVPGSRE